MNRRYLWFAAGIGAALGAACALLFAPQTGARTRKRLRRGLEEIGESLEDAGEYLKEQAERLGTEARRAVEEGSGRLGEVAATVVEQSAASLEGAKKKVTSMF